MDHLALLLHTTKPPSPSFCQLELQALNMSLKKPQKRSIPLYARRLARFHEDLANEVSKPQLTASRDDTRLVFSGPLSDHHISSDDASSSSSQQPIMLKIPVSPKRTASTRFNIRDVLKQNRVTDTLIADNANEEDEESEELDGEALTKRGQREQDGGLLEIKDTNDADEEDVDNPDVLLPSEARIEEIVEIFGDALQKKIGENYRERIAEMYENDEASHLYAILQSVAGDELLRGIDTATRPSYDLDDHMELDANEEASSEDSIEEEVKNRLKNAAEQLRANADDIVMQDAFEKTVHDTLDRKKTRLDDRNSVDRALIFDIMNNSLGRDIETVIAKLTLPNLRDRIEKKYSYLLPIFRNPEYEAAFRAIYTQIVIMTALHLRSFTKPETRPTLSLAWGLFYGSINGSTRGKTGPSVPSTHELGFDPKGDQISVATAVSNEIVALEKAMDVFTDDFNQKIAEAPVDTPGAEFFRALNSSDYNVSVNFVPSFECREGTETRCAISGEPLKTGDSVYVCRFLGLRMADQSLIPPVFRGSGSWQNQKYRDVFHIYCIKQHISEYPPQLLRDMPVTAAASPSTTEKPTKTKKGPALKQHVFSGVGLECWKADGEGGGYYLRYSALLEKIISFQTNVFRKNPGAVLASISKLTKDPASFSHLVESLRIDDLRAPKTLGMKLKAIADAIGNTHAHMARDILAACFCEIEDGHRWLIREKPAYMKGYGLVSGAEDAIRAIVTVANTKSRFIDIFCRPRQSKEQYDQLLSVSKELVGAKTALPALLSVVKIIDTLLCISPVAK